MDKRWKSCKKILCVRLDNMGDLLMTSPALMALSATLDCHLTVLCSSMAAGIAADIPGIDEVIVFNAPWMKLEATADWAAYQQLVELIAGKQFDAAIIFTVFSQNPLPAAMLAMHAGIPLRLAYCRENPYQLLTDWLPDKEPIDYIRHQVERDLYLVQSIGMDTGDTHLQVHVHEELWAHLSSRLAGMGVDLQRPWIVVHPSVSDKKRRYDKEKWMVVCRELRKRTGCQLLITGGDEEEAFCAELAKLTGGISLGGALSLRELVLLIARSPLLLSVNTGAVHIAAATQTPVVVLYALTNPQHTPWKVMHEVLVFDVPEHMQSHNQLLVYAAARSQAVSYKFATPANVINTVCRLWQQLPVAGEYGHRAQQQ